MKSIGMAVSLPAPGKINRQSGSIAVGATRVLLPESWNLQFDGADLSFDRLPDAVSVPINFRSRFEKVHLEHTGEVKIDADFPLLEAAVSGQLTPEVVPNRFMGTFAFRASGTDPADEVVGTDKPIFVMADFWKGLLDVPDQSVIVREALLSETRTELPVHVQVAGRLSSISPNLTARLDAATGLSQFEQKLGSTRIALDDVQVVRAARLGHELPKARGTDRGRGAGLAAAFGEDQRQQFGG